MVKGFNRAGGHICTHACVIWGGGSESHSAAFEIITPVHHDPNPTQRYVIIEWDELVALLSSRQEAPFQVQFITVSASSKFHAHEHGLMLSRQKLSYWIHQMTKYTRSACGRELEGCLIMSKIIEQDVLILTLKYASLVACGL